VTVADSDTLVVVTKQARVLFAFLVAASCGSSPTPVPLMPLTPD
jgi:hypothetical protein